MMKSDHTQLFPNGANYIYDNQVFGLYCFAVITMSLAEPFWRGGISILLYLTVLPGRREAQGATPLIAESGGGSDEEAAAHVGEFRRR